MQTTACCQSFQLAHTENEDKAKSGYTLESGHIHRWALVWRDIYDCQRVTRFVGGGPFKRWSLVGKIRWLTMCPWKVHWDPSFCLAQSRSHTCTMMSCVIIGPRPQGLWAEVPETESQINLFFFEVHCIKCFVIVTERLNRHQEMCPELVGSVQTE